MTWSGSVDLFGRELVHWESAWFDITGRNGCWFAGGYEYVSLEGLDAFAAWVRS